MRKVLLARSAAADIAGHIRYAEGFGVAPAERLLSRLRQTLSALALFPYAGVDLGRRRKFPVPGTTLVPVYRLRGDTVQIRAASTDV